MKKLNKMFTIFLSFLMAFTCVIPAYAGSEMIDEAGTVIKTTETQETVEELSSYVSDNGIDIGAIENLTNAGTYVGRYVTFNSTGLVTVYNGVDGQGFNSMVSNLADTFVALYKHVGAEDAVWYELDSSQWPSRYADYKYVKAEDITLGKCVEEPIISEVSGKIGECQVTVSGSIPIGVTLSLADVEIDVHEFGIENVEDIVTSLDIKLMDGDTEWQPAKGESITITLDAAVLGMSDGDEFIVYHQHDGEISVSDTYVVENGMLTFVSDGFSIYVVVGDYSNDWNYNNYKIVMTVGDSLQVSTSSNNNGNNYSWSLTSGDIGAFTLTNTNNRQAIITAKESGEVTLQCVISKLYGNNTTEKLQVVALPTVGASVNDDIIFANIDKAYTTGDTEYENTYGPYVMKIRFEDPDGNVLKYADNVTVGEEYYVFDSECNIDVNTFSASAPNGYTYAGSFFYWGGHFGGDKVYVTSVERDNSNTATGSHLLYKGTHNTSGAGRWTYQASGVLHVVYAPIEEVYTITFKDHCGYELANYALEHNDRGVTFPSGYVANIENMTSILIPDHHDVHDLGYIFDNTWVVAGGGKGIDGTYTTSELKNKIVQWDIKSNITITAQCSEPEVIINYVVVDNVGGTVSPTSETVKVSSENAAGSVAKPNDNYEFVGWYEDEKCTILLGTDEEFVPQKKDNKNVASTYYAKFEIAITDLTITKSGSESIDEMQSFVFEISGEGIKLSVVINGNGSATIQNLPIGTYTVTENKAWSWRYTPDKDRQEITLSASSKNEVIFNNERSSDDWLSNDSFVENQFTVKNEGE